MSFFNLELTPRPINAYQNRVRPCRYCGFYIYLDQIKLNNGRSRFLPKNEGPNTLHDCPMRNKGR